MSTFNLKKYAKKNVTKPFEKLLTENRDKDGNEVPDNMITEKLLKEDRNEVDNVITEKQFDRKASSENIILEKQMNKGTGSWMKHRRDDAVPVMEMYKEFEEKYQKAYKEAENKDKLDTTFWDGYVGVQTPKDMITKIVGNDQHSQLVSNYNSRKEFLKKNPEIAKSATKTASIDSLKDADAMLYHIYRTASDQGRELTEIEIQKINDINSGKIRLLAQNNDFLAEKDEELEKMQEDAMNESDKKYKNVCPKCGEFSCGCDIKGFKEINEHKGKDIPQEKDCY